MTTKNIIPQADGEGSIGINGTSWASGVFNTGVFEEVLVGGSNVVLSSDFGTVLNNYVSKSEISIGTNANVGIGTTAPDHKLHIFGGLPSMKLEGTQPRILLSENDQTDLNTLIRNNGSLFEIDTVKDDDSFVANRLTINHANGNVGIGTTNPSSKLQVNTFEDVTSVAVTCTNGETTVSLTEDLTSVLSAGDTIRFGNSGAGDVSTKQYEVESITDSLLTLTQALNFTASLHISKNLSTLNVQSSNVGIGTESPAAKLDVQGDISISGAIVSSDSDGRVVFSDQGLMVGQAEVKPDPDNPTSIYFESIPQVQDSEGNAVTILTADKLGLGTSAVLNQSEQDLQFKLLTDQKRFVVGTSGNAENTIASGWYRFNDFQVKGATDIGVHSINPVDTRIYSDESSFILFKTDTAGNRVAHLVGGNEEVSPNNAIALGIAVKVDDLEFPEDIEFVHTDGETYSVINGNSDSLGSNGLPLRQGFQSPSLGSTPSPLLIDGGSF
tara:strand:- start:12688 stop:14181 length:1494 start_codon:yes stop_codon:yes gene_type:complete